MRDRDTRGRPASAEVPSSGVRVPAVDLRAVRQLDARGLPLHQMAAELGVSKTTVVRARLALGLPRRPSGPAPRRRLTAAHVRALLAAGHSADELPALLGFKPHVLRKRLDAMGGLRAIRSGHPAHAHPAEVRHRPAQEDDSVARASGGLITSTGLREALVLAYTRWGSLVGPACGTLY